MYAVIWIWIRAVRYVDATGRALQFASPLLRSDSYIRLHWEKSWTGIRSGDGEQVEGVAETGASSGKSYYRCYQCSCPNLKNNSARSNVLNIKCVNFKTDRNPGGKQPFAVLSFIDLALERKSNYSVRNSRERHENKII